MGKERKKPVSKVSDKPRTINTNSPQTNPKRNPFVHAEQALYVFVSVLLWLFMIGWVTGKPLVGILLADPVRTIREILIAPFKFVFGDGLVDAAVASFAFSFQSQWSRVKGISATGTDGDSITASNLDDFE
ncbi:hypothetical protein HK100_010732 [Physocladia obscura]|uniref:Uncharacterized protein n=1 Tax=Physocladia obscura TaxID=109957 RepID=A0AAD5T3Y6_9FUNG|nr:hypothetical protein HK100_010732 [Physocladia obscura]